MFRAFSFPAPRLMLAALAAFSWTGSSAKADESPSPETLISISEANPIELHLSEPLIVGTLNIVEFTGLKSLPFLYGGILAAPAVLTTGSITSNSYPIECYSGSCVGCVVYSGVTTYLSAGTLSVATTGSSMTKAGTGTLILSGANSDVASRTYTAPATWLTLPTSKSQKVNIYDPNGQKPFLVKTDFTIADDSWSSNTTPRFLAELTQESNLASLKSQLDDHASVLTAWDVSLDTGMLMIRGTLGESSSLRLSNVASASMSILADTDFLSSPPLTLWHRQDELSDWVRLPSEVTYDGQYLNFSANEGLFGTYAITGIEASIPEPASLGLLVLAGGSIAMRRRSTAS